MPKWLKLRSLFMRFPALDGWRLSWLAHICTAGPVFFGGSYNITRVISPGAEACLRELQAAEQSCRPAIFAIYHGRMVGLLGLERRDKLTILISRSRDGEIIARACRDMGFSVARGSPAVGGFKGARELVAQAESGQSIAFTVDGPRGPAHKVKAGVIRLAELTQLPIVPFVCRARTTYWMKSWDKFMAPLWATPIVYLFGEPITVSRDMSDQTRELLRTRLEMAMNELRQCSDSLIEVLN